ncbi:MAG: OmpA family protein [Candidatus Eisenbacteria bacterium]
MRGFMTFLALVVISAFLAATCPPTRAGFGGLTDKLKQKAGEKLDKKVDQALDKSESDSTKSAEKPEGQAQDAASEPAGGAKGGTAASEDMALYTKYDFVPGDKVIFFDDLWGEEVGEFPTRWNLDQGVFEIVKQGGKNYIMCTDEGTIRPKIAPGPLPAKYTVEMELTAKGPDFKGHWFYIRWLNAAGEEIGELSIQDTDHTRLIIAEKELASKLLAAPLSMGIHTMRIMATKTTMKCYIDNERVANVPAIEGFQPVGFQVRMDPWKDEPDNPMLIGSFRYAEGGKTLKEQLDETGRIVTHGILFDSGSARIKAESHKTLADIGQLLSDIANLQLSIEGHTDSDGADDYNLKLSQDRANSVKTYLVETYKIDPKRLETKGWGEGKSIDTNETPEGKANNRRVELVKI